MIVAEYLQDRAGLHKGLDLLQQNRRQVWLRAHDLRLVVLLIFNLTSLLIDVGLHSIGNG